MRLLRIFLIEFLLSHVDKLAVVEVVVETVLLHKVVVGALLDDLAVFHDQNPVRIADRGETMGYDEACASLHELIRRLPESAARYGYRCWRLLRRESAWAAGRA